LTARLKREAGVRPYGGHPDGAQTPHDEVAAIQPRIFAEQTGSMAMERNAEIGAPTNPAKLADAVLAAGERARSGTDSDLAPEPDALAQAIIDAGKARRRPFGD
jgi:hypothetical protein